MMDRYTVAMRPEYLGFPERVLKEELRFALLCPDKTHEKDPGHRMP